VVIADKSDEPAISASPVEDPCRVHDGDSNRGECCTQRGCHTVYDRDKNVALCITADLLCYSDHHGNDVTENDCPPGYACTIVSGADAKEVDGCEHDGEYDIDFSRLYCEWTGS
jgi:hypothetical protein